MLNWFQPYQTPMFKYADYVEKKIQILLYTCAVTVNILSNSNKNFLLKKLISVIFLTNFSSAKSIDFIVYRITEIFKMSFRKSRVASAAFLTRFNYIYSDETKWRLFYRICHCKIDSSGPLSPVICLLSRYFLFSWGDHQ